MSQDEAKDRRMNDVLMITLLLAAIAAAGGFVRACASFTRPPH
jgi:hypothetical protein